MPGFIDPQLATLSDTTPSGPKWVHEVKFDGYRVQVHVESRSITVYTRRGEDWTKRFPHIAKAARHLPECVIDGEAIVPDEEGRSDFSALQSAVAGGNKKPIVLYAFDLLWLEGQDFRRRKLLDRKEALKRLLEAHAKQLAPSILYSQHFTEEGPHFRAAACAMGLEGVVSKRIDATYHSTRNESWIKSKCGERDTFVIGGWRQTAGGMQSIALGQFRNKGFEYIGKARTGFQSKQEELLPRLKAVEVSQIPFTKGRPERKEGQHWCKPELQAEVSFTAWTASRHLRHAKFLGLREDMPFEQPKAKASAKPASKNVQRLLSGGIHPEDAELKAYWKKVGSKALKYLGRRPLTLVRHDRGQVFFHTGPLPETAKSIHRLTIEKREGGEGTRLWVSSVAGLVALVDIGVVEVHPWNARVDDIEHPDQFILDLDPGEGIEWEFVKDSALTLRDFLKEEEGLNSWPKATGGKGLHVVVPLDCSRDHDAARAYSKQVASRFAARDRRYTVLASLAMRKHHLFIDYLRNGRGQTAIGTYSPRARPRFPIAVPLTWEQVEKGVKSDAVTLAKTIGGRIA
jgi:bifunctional non-homologous end joining protein LigD